jgi:hypothetical protein
MTQGIDLRRRRLLWTKGLILAGAVCAPVVLVRHAFAEDRKGALETLKETISGKGKEEVTPPEDLMREHGVLDRVLLVYEAAVRKFQLARISIRRWSPDRRKLSATSSTTITKSWKKTTSCRASSRRAA